MRSYRLGQKFGEFYQITKLCLSQFSHCYQYFNVFRCPIVVIRTFSHATGQRLCICAEHSYSSLPSLPSFLNARNNSQTLAIFNIWLTKIHLGQPSLLYICHGTAINSLLNVHIFRKMADQFLTLISTTLRMCSTATCLLYMSL